MINDIATPTHDRTPGPTDSVDRVTEIDLIDGRELTVRFGDDATMRCNRFWLRDNAPSNGERVTLFRTFSVADLSDDFVIVAADVVAGDLRVEFSDGAADVFTAAFLRSWSDSRRSEPTWEPWRSGFEPAQIRFDAELAGSSRHHQLLGAVHRHGFALVTDIPDDPGATEVIASWLGPIRETDFGRVFDIVTEVDPFTPSQSVEALDPHTDEPYRYSPSGISILHCVSPSSDSGGASTIVDGFAVASAMAEEDPAAFQLLSTVAVPYAHRRVQSVEQGAAVDLRASAPVIALDADGWIRGIRFHERSMATFDLDRDIVDDFYLALAGFSRRVRGGAFTYERRLAAGEAIVYDNERVLHGRTAIAAATGGRHLRLCNVDRDQVHSRFRQLSERYAPGTENQPLAAGSRS